MKHHDCVTKDQDLLIMKVVEESVMLAPAADRVVDPEGCDTSDEGCF